MPRQNFRHVRGNKSQCLGKDLKSYLINDTECIKVTRLPRRPLPVLLVLARKDAVSRFHSVLLSVLVRRLSLQCFVFGFAQV